ncbi:MAG: glycosyltransferase family 39 protein [Bacteroidetes bacterium]|nr:glycosyltransferase family 39 protein [Bacteroidota bacterium]
MSGENLFQLAMVLHVGAVLLFLSDRQRWALLTLLTGGVILRYYFATLDPFLHDWDERFHALVAKNLTQHWLRPTLVEHHILSNVKEEWTDKHIWLHKQPLFLWQMALSIRLFGATEFAVRLPSLIMTSILIPAIYQIGRMVFNPIAGFIAAFILSCYEPLLEMNSGMMGMEHNDIAFLFYVTLSIWAWICYEQRQRTGYLLMMGFFAGCAVLCKWLTGMLVFSGFIVYHLLLAKDLFTAGTVKNLVKALVVCFVVFLPWQLYILWQYPVEAHSEYAYNSKHFFQVVEGHEHETWFYLNILPDYYRGLQYLIGLSIVVALLFARRLRLAASLSFTFVLVYCFFTVAQTKLPSYVMVVMPLGLLLLSAIISWVMRLIWHYNALRYLLGSVVFVALLLQFVHWPLIVENHFDPDTWQGHTRTAKLEYVDAFKKLTGRLPSNTVILDLGNMKNIDLMFYTGVPAYSGRYDSDYYFLKGHKYNVVFWADSLPVYARRDSTTHLIKDYLPR